MNSATLLKEFFAEAQDHIATAEEDILALEETARDPQGETVNRLFRALHTIKGGASCVNLDKVKELAHALENVVGMIRTGTLIPGRTVTETLLHGVDKLKSAIMSGSGIVEDADQIMARLREIIQTPSEIQPAQLVAAPATGRIFDLAKVDTSQAVAEGLSLHEFTLDIMAECKRIKCKPRELLEKVKSVGTVLAATQDISTLGRIPSKSSPCSFLLATMIDDAEILFPGLSIEPVLSHTYPRDQIPDFDPTGVVEARDMSAMGEISEIFSIPATEVTTVPPAHQIVSGATKGVAAKPAPEPASVKAPIEQTVRIPVETIDKLMNLAGELVVVRNRNAQVLASGNIRELSAVNQRLDVVTSDIQRTVMKTRMQPVGNVFGRFTRVVHDLSRSLGKEIELEISGSDVELDKSIIDGIVEPLTHLVRNSVDHGIEMPDRRIASGKPAVGHIRPKAYHQTGLVNIQVIDDGKGMDPQKIRESAIEKGLLTQSQAETLSERESLELIFFPGFSTATQVTEISGRGVGMDVVKTSLQKFGGVVEIKSAPGAGSTITIRLPLTLAIIPAIILMVQDQCFAIPQVNVREVVWLHGDEIYQSIRTIDDNEVYWLRGKMLPLIRLSRVLKIDRTYPDPQTGESTDDRRVDEADRRQKSEYPDMDKRTGPVDRRTSLDNSMYIIVLQIGSDRFGVCVERIIDTEEIVVKPLHDRLKASRVYAGVTVLGDGATALILDVLELAQTGGMRCNKTETSMVKQRVSTDDRQKLLVFTIGNAERFALPLSLLMRVDEVSTKEIQTAGGREFLSFRNSLIPVVRMEGIVRGHPPQYDPDFIYAIIPKIGRPVGIAAARIIDIMEVENKMDAGPTGQTVIIGSQLIDGHATSILDLCTLVEAADPGWISTVARSAIIKKRIILAEDSSFFRALISSYLRGIGLDVLEAINGKVALDLVRQEQVDCIISDIEMPVMDGFDLARRIKADEALRSIPLLGISAMDEAIVRPRALDAGFDDFRSKNDLPMLGRTIETLFSKHVRS